MKIRRYPSPVFLFFFLLTFKMLSAQKNEELSVTGSFHSSFVDFAAQLEREYPVRFFYRDEWVDTLKVNLDVKECPLMQLMDQVLRSTQFGYWLEAPGTIYILPDRKFVGQLPLFHLPEEESKENIAGPEPAAGGLPNRYLQGRRPDMIETIIIGSRDQARQGKRAVVTGKLTDAENGEPLIGATVYVSDLEKGAVTDQDGMLTLSLKTGSYQAVFRCVGMKELKGNLDVRSDGFFSLSMEKEVRAIEEVVVTGEETVKHGARPGLESVSVKTIKELPALMGEKDVMKIAQMLPGIVSVGEGSAGINVRGGNADQNLFYINKIPVYNSSHLFGFFSSINSDIIDNFSVYKGQIPAEYGGRLSSVFNVTTRRGNKNKTFSQGGISPISANAELEMPLKKEKASIMLSARSSYSDWILGRLKDPDLRNSSASFYDFATALDFNISEKNKVELFAYHSNDDFDLSKHSSYGYTNSGASVNLLHYFSPRLKSSVSLIGADYHFHKTEKSSVNDAYHHSYKLRHYEFRAHIDWHTGERHLLKAGVNSIFYDLNRGSVSPWGEGSLKIPVDLGKERGIEYAFFLDDNISLRKGVKLYAGIRYSLFTSLGPKTVRSYYPDTPREDSYVQNTTDYEKGEKIVRYRNPELRAGLDVRTGDFSSLRFSLTQMSQYLFMLSNTISIAPNDQWKLVDKHIKPPSSSQYTAGFYQELPWTKLSFSCEVYYKKAKNVVEYKDGADFLASPFVETSVLQGRHQAYGTELMLARETGRLSGWASYTYSRSLVTVDGPSDWADINHGQTYPANFDKPHVANLVLTYKFNHRFSLSSNVTYNTGRPVTMPESIYYIGDQPFIEYSDRNEYRIPDYFRLDISLKAEGNLKKKKPIHSYWLLNVFNLTGRSNANTLFFVSEEGHIRAYKYSVIGVPILTLSWNWKLGNYANN